MNKKVRIEKIKIKNIDTSKSKWLNISFPNKNAYTWYQIIKMMNIFHKHNGEIRGNTIIVREDVHKQVFADIKKELGMEFQSVDKVNGEKQRLTLPDPVVPKLKN